ncbi:hypothetical protein AMS58_09520 [Pseudoalteromonas porphyrae]|nr:hypothetical protein AMS58_09520 [Pseudoalteromonas porphyrae]
MAYYFERDIVSWGQDQTGLFPRALGNRIMINPAFSMQGDNQREMLRAHGINEIIKALEKY